MSENEPGPAPERKIWIDGELVAWERATVHVLSHSLQRGSLVFDYMSVHSTPRGAAVFRLPDHAQRFLHSCELVGLPLEQDASDVCAAIAETVRANPGATAVKTSAFFASVEVDVVPLDDRVSLAIAAYDPDRDVNQPKRRQPNHPRELRLWVEKERRNRRADIVPPQAKVAANYVSPMMAKWKARRAGYDEIVLLDEAGNLAEGPTTNLFLVDREGHLRTPPELGVLPGITRRSIIELAKHEGIPVSESVLPPQALDEASEVFLTGTSAGVWPVGSVDGRKVGDGSPGPVSRALHKRFRRVVSGEDPDFEHWLHPVDEPRDGTPEGGA